MDFFVFRNETVTVNATVLNETVVGGGALLNTSHVPKQMTEEEEEELFEPNIVNSAVYIISLALQIATFAINYRGAPYMESLRQNKALLYSILGSGGVVLALTLGIVPELATLFEIIDFPPDVWSFFYDYNVLETDLCFFLFQFRNILLQVLFADFFFSYLVDRVCLWLCGEGSLKIS